MTFRLPISHNYECYTSDSTRVGLDVFAGLPNHQHAPITLAGSDDDDGDPGNLVLTEGVAYNGMHDILNSHTGDVSNNSIYGNSNTVTPPHTEFYLYFKVANAVQNLELLNAGAVLEAVDNVINQWNDYMS